MAELIEFIIGAILCVVVVCIVLCFYFIISIFISFVNICKAIYKHIGTRTRKIPGPDDEYALDSYFCWNGDWYQNLKAVALEYQNLTTDFWKSIAAHKTQSTAWLYNEPCATVVSICSVIWMLLLVVVMFCLFLVCCLVHAAVASFFHMMEVFVMKGYGLATQCPHCGRRATPIYHCPKCSHEQKSLVPTVRYGIFYRTCMCGASIPTSRFWGKQKLRKTCSYCKKNQVGEYVPRTIAMIGGTSVGKTFLCRCICAQMQDVVEKGLGWKYSEPAQSAAAIAQMKNDLKNGICTSTTQDDGTGLIEAVCVDVQKPKSAFPTRLYFCDPPGESFDIISKLYSYSYYDHLSVVIIVIDPCTIPSLESKLRSAVRDVSREIAPSTKYLEDNLDSWIVAMEQYHQGLTNDVCCAVVINKVDIPELRSYGISPKMDSAQCRMFLENQEMGHYLSKLDNTFKECGFFAVSCTGGRVSGTEYQPEGVDDVVRWILNHV